MSNITMPLSRQINYKVMRIIVGIIALLLSPTVWILSGVGSEMTSISISYWTDSRDIFVGSLIAVGFFLSAYNGAGNGRDLGYALSKAACVFAVCVAFFPTCGFSAADVPARWILAISDFVGLTHRTIHITAAVLLFTCLIVLMWTFSKRAKSKGKPGRAYLYRGISILMGGGMIGIYLLGEIIEIDDTFFWVEYWGLTLFGIGWIAAGSYKTEDHPSEC